MRKRDMAARIAGAAIAAALLLPAVAVPLAERVPEDGAGQVAGAALAYVLAIGGMAALFALPRLEPRVFMLTGSATALAFAGWASVRFLANDDDEYLGSGARDGAIEIFVIVGVIGLAVVAIGALVLLLTHRLVAAGHR